MANKVLEIDFWNEWAGKTYTVPANTKYDTIKITNYNYINFPILAIAISPDKRDLQIYGGNNGGASWIIIKDYIAKNGAHAIKYFEAKNTTLVLLDYVNSELFRTGTPIIQGKNNVYVGNNFSSQMNGTDKNEKMYGYGGMDRIYGNGGNDYIDGGADNDFLYGQDGNDTIIGGLGNDLIDGGSGNDILTGGTGTNTILLYTNSDFGSDTVNLTKGENLILKLNNEGSNINCVKYYIENKDLVVDVYNQDVSETTEGATKQGSVRIKNYTTKDVITNTGSLIIKDYNDNQVNLRESMQVEVIMDSEHYNKQAYTGSWLNDTVYANNYKMYKDKNKTQEITTETVGYEKIKGVTINLGGSSGASGNFARGSIYSDTINGGEGYDVIEGGKGNDVIKGGAGTNVINISATEAFGDDVVALTKG